MKNITLSAAEETIEKARKVAVEQHTTLNAMFRDWLGDLSNKQTDDKGIEARLNELWKQTDYIKVGEKLTRDEMNER